MPSAYIRLVVKHPCLVFSAMLCLLLPTAFFGVTNFTLSDPEGGQQVRDSLEAEHAHAFQRAADAATSAFADERYEPQQTRELANLKLYYTAGGSAASDNRRDENVLTIENIQRIAQLEDELIALSGGEAWEEVCLRERGQASCAPIVSVVPYLRHAQTDAELRAAIDAMHETLDGSIDSPLSVTASWFFEQALEHGRYESYILRSHMRLGAPLAIGSWLDGGDEDGAFLNWQDRQSEQQRRVMSRFLRPAQALLRDKAASWQEDADRSSAAAAGLSLLFAQDWLYTEEYSGIILSDLIFTAGSVMMVYGVLWAYTSSALLSFFGLIQILLAFPVTLFVYAVVLRIKLFGVLQAMSADHTLASSCL